MKASCAAAIDLFHSASPCNAAGREQTVRER